MVIYTFAKKGEGGLSRLCVPPYIPVQNTTILVYAKNIGPWDLTDVQCFWSNVSNFRSIFGLDQNVRCRYVLFKMFVKHVSIQIRKRM